MYSAMVTLLNLSSKRERRRLFQSMGLGAGVTIALSSCRPIATPEAVQQVEQAFVDHREDFIEVATVAVADLQQSGESSLRLPDQTFYDSAWVSVTLNNEALDVEFVIEEFYLPLVYVSTDQPADVHDTCTNGGMVIKQLEPYWYICQRDWN